MVIGTTQISKTDITKEQGSGSTFGNWRTYEIEWEILAKDKPFNPVTGVCRLCLLEAYHLMFDKINTTLNGRDEYFSVCPHKKNYLLMKGWTELLT